MEIPKLKTPEILAWVFFISRGITDSTDLTRCLMLCSEICAKEERATVENIKDTTGYRSCLCDIPSELISDEAIQEMIDFDKKK